MSETMDRFCEGRRVVVKIGKPDEYAYGAAKALEGSTGVIEKVSEKGVFGSSPAFLVCFDKLVPAWHSHGMPCQAFWFEACDLIDEHKHV